MTQYRAGHAAWQAEDADAFLQLFTGQTKQYGLVFVNADGHITGWAEGSYALTGFTADEVLGRPLSLLFTPEDVARNVHVHEQRIATLLGASEDERWHMRKDGSRFWASGITARLGGEGQPVRFAKLFRDATHLRLRLDSLDNEVRQLAKAQHDRNVFLGTIAHELRNPLQPMTVAAHLLERPVDPARHDQAIKILNRQLGFMGRLVEDLIDMTRVTQGRMSMAYQRVSLQRLLEETVEGSREAAIAKGLSLITVLPPVPVEVEVDPARLTQVVVNLLNNAIKFTPAGGRVSLLANIDQTHFVVQVLDTGKGIGPDLQPEIFDMFTQADGADTGRGQGLGIGLALVKQIVSLHHGSVEARSEGVGQGSEFSVRLPLNRPQSVPT